MNRDPLDREALCTENHPLDIDPPWHRCLLAAAAAVGTHPAGMHSCCQLEFLGSSRNTLRFF